MCAICFRFLLAQGNDNLCQRSTSFNIGLINNILRQTPFKLSPQPDLLYRINHYARDLFCISSLEGLNIYSLLNCLSFYFFPIHQQLVVMMPAPSATIFARRALSYLMNDQAELALRDAMQAQVCIQEWPTAFYLQAIALSKLGMETDAQDMLNDGAAFDSKKQNSWRN